MNLERNCRCDLCKDKDRPGCREVRHAIQEVEKALAETTTRAARHAVALPPVSWHLNVPCWYSARRARREG